MNIAMSVDLSPISCSLEVDEFGDIRVSGTRVLLDVLLVKFKQGATPEDIQQSFPTLSLPSVYAVIAFYLQRTAQVDEYLAERKRAALELRARIEARQGPQDGFRDRLLARGKA